MTGRLRMLYAVVGTIVFLLLTFAVLVAAFRSSPPTATEEQAIDSRLEERWEFIQPNNRWSVDHAV
jgi:hypothetical protein